MDPKPITNLKKLRTERRLTQEQLGAAIGITTRTLIRWEAGQGEPGLSELIALARFYEISLDQLVGELIPPESTGALPKVSDLSGAQLNYWVARTLGLPAQMTEDGPVIYEPGYGQRPVPDYCNDYADGGPIIGLQKIQLQTIAAGETFDGKVLTTGGWIARCSAHPTAAFGARELEAAMRAFLTYAIGIHILA